MSKIGQITGFEGDATDADRARAGERNYAMDPYSGMPTYQPGYDPNTMALYPKFQGQINAINPNTQGLDKFRGEALRSGPSAWANLARGQQFSEQANAQEQAAKAAASGTATAASDLAMRGGINSGARERIAAGGVKNLLDMNQNAARQGNLNRLQIGVNDEQNRISQLGQLPGMENQALQPQFDKLKLGIGLSQSDLQNQIAENQAMNQFRGNVWGSAKQASIAAGS